MSAITTKRLVLFVSVLLIASIAAAHEDKQTQRIYEQVHALCLSIEKSQPLLLFTEVTTPLLVESNTAIKYTRFINVQGVINSFGDAQTVLFSRDELGQNAPGHLSLSVYPDGRVQLRNQGPEGVPSVVLLSAPVVIPTVEFNIAVVIGPDELALYVNGDKVKGVDTFYELSGNDLPLVIGGTCWAVTQEVCEEKGRQFNHAVDGALTVELYRSEVITITRMGLYRSEVITITGMGL